MRGHLAVRAVLGLGEEISSDMSGVGVRVRNDQHLRGPGRHVDGHHGLAVLQQHLGRRHVLIPRAQQTCPPAHPIMTLT